MSDLPADAAPTRRRALALLAGLAAGTGCIDQRPAGTRTPAPDDSGTPTATATGSSAASSTPTATPNPTTEARVVAGPATCSPADRAVESGTWPTARHDSGGTRAAPRVTGPDGPPLTRRWTVESVETATTVPVADTDAVYALVTGGAVYPNAEDDEEADAVVLRAAPDGRVDWRATSPDSGRGHLAVGDETLYVPLGTYKSARIHALAVADGTDRGAFGPDGSRLGGAPVTLGDGLLLPFDGACHRLDAAGERCWTFRPGDDSRAAVFDRHVTDAVVAGGRTVVGTASHDDDALPADVGTVFAVADGALSWRTDLDSPVTGLLADDGRLLAATGRGLRSVSPADGRERWRLDFEARVRPPTLALAADTAVVGTVETVVGVDAESGTERWRRELSSWRVAVVGPTVYAISWESPDGGATLRALSLDGGETRWRHETDAPLRTLSAAHGHLYAGTGDGRLFAYA